MSADAADTLYGTQPPPPAAPAAPPAAKSVVSTLYCQTPEPAAPAPTPAPAPAPAPAAPAPAAAAPAPAPAPAAPQPEANIADAPATGVLAQVTADAIRAAIPEEISAARKADTARSLFGDRERDALAESFALEEVEGIQPETLAAVKTELANMAIDAGATRADVDVLRVALAESHAPMTDEQRTASRDACVSAYNETYGEQAYKTLEITLAWIQQDPRRHALFAQVGDDPQAALLAARLALAAQRRR